MKKINILILLTTIIQFSFSQNTPVDKAVLNIDFSKPIGTMRPLWTWFGSDEPNYAYMRDGKKLLSELSALSPVPVYFRTHNLLTSGHDTLSLKWGSTNVYTEDVNGNPIYDFTVIDKIVGK